VADGKKKWARNGAPSSASLRTGERAGATKATTTTTTTTTVDERRAGGGAFAHYTAAAVVSARGGDRPRLVRVRARGRGWRDRRPSSPPAVLRIVYVTSAAVTLLPDLPTGPKIILSPLAVHATLAPFRYALVVHFFISVRFCDCVCVPLSVRLDIIAVYDIVDQR